MGITSYIATFISSLNWNLIIQLFIIIGMGLISLYFRSYIREKGKNLATKEDIDKISFQSEKAKNLATKEDIEELTKKVESTKASVEIALKYKESEKFHLLKFYEAAYILKLKTDKDLGNLRLTSPDFPELKTFIREQEESFEKFKISYYNFLPYETSKCDELNVYIGKLFNAMNLLKAGFRSKEYSNFKIEFLSYYTDLAKMQWRTQEEFEALMNRTIPFERKYFEVITPLRKTYEQALLAFVKELKNFIYSDIIH